MVESIFTVLLIIVLSAVVALVVVLCFAIVCDVIGDLLDGNF